MKRIFDIGMYDGADTEYYLSIGYSVVAVEANPALVERAKVKFSGELAAGTLTLVNAALADRSGESVTLFVSGDDLGSSSVSMESLATRNIIGSYSVSSVTIGDLFAAQGIPHFMKVDIEGADRLCILPLTREARPRYVSFEAGDDAEVLVAHLAAIGYSQFKAICQCNFMELGNQESIAFRVKRKIINVLGYKEPQFVRQNGRFFKLEHSAGPVPWESDGGWYSSNELLVRWKRAKSASDFGGWFDIHAT